MNNRKVSVGDKIRIIKMNDRAGVSYNGKEGYVQHIDDLGQLHGNWGGLAVIPDIDEFIVLDV